FAFVNANSSKLLSVSLPNITRLENGVFTSCGKLQSIILPNTLKYIGDGAFWECKSLQNIVIPDGVEIIDNSAFADCISLNTIMIPPSVTTFGSDPYDEYIFVNSDTFQQLDVVIYCQKGSAADAHAKKYNIKVVYQ
ncbi:MAG: leucine-rich repeat domain-containing protein, partial [Acidaminococcaceae bacterium]|nr:leucine-rich repeat domain-containing protein [Acidaminococcaceae bacterium]